MMNKRIRRLLAALLSVQLLVTATAPAFAQDAADGAELSEAVVIYRVGGMPAVAESDAIVPETIVPETIVPETIVPETIVPETIVPETIIPETIVPETIIPETIVPETIVPETIVPETIIPETVVPDTLLTGEEGGSEPEKTVAAPGAAYVIEGDTLKVTVKGEPGLKMYLDVTIDWKETVYAGETHTFTGFEPGKSYGIEVDYHELQKGVSAYRTSFTMPAAEEPTPTPTPPAEEPTPTPPVVEEITPTPVPAVTQFDVTLSQSGGVITAEVTHAAQREVELTLIYGGKQVEMRSLIGNGTVSFSRQGDGVYNVQAEYVTPAEGVTAVVKSIEISGTGSSGGDISEKKPTVMALGAAVTVGDTWIEVRVTDADDWPLYVAVGSEIKMASLGDAVRFEGLSLGEYGVEVDYVDPVAGVSPFRKSVEITSPAAQAKPITVTAAAGSALIDVIVTDASTLPIAVTLSNASGYSAKKTIPGGIGKVTFDGLVAGTYDVSANYEPAQSGVSAAKVTGVVVAASAPEAKDIAFSAAGGMQKITVSVTDASPLPISVRVRLGGSEVAKKTIAAGVGTVEFNGLPAGSYTVAVNYDPAQSGVYEREQTGVIVTGQTASIAITSVAGGENKLTVCGTAQPGADVALTTVPKSSTTIVRADASGVFRTDMICQAGTYTQVNAAYVADNTVTASFSGSFVVTPSADRPTLVVDPIGKNMMGATAKTQPGVKVNLRVKEFNYGQTVVADARGILRYSFPQTYPKGTVVTFTVFYGPDNAYSYQVQVKVTGKVIYGTLSYGDTGSEVKALTKRLEELGYLADDTSRYSSAVRDAVRLFQQMNGLDADGIAGPKTQEKLFSVSAIPYGESGIYPTLVRGDRGTALLYKLQQRLKDLGYYTLKVDGIFGSGTQRAVRDFQRNNGLSVTGKADNATQQVLYSSAAKPAGSGSSGSYQTLYRSKYYQAAVVPLQRRLKALGYLSGSVDGYYGSQTQRAVRNFQQRNGLSVTGTADPYTQQVLYSSSAVAASGSSGGSSSSSSYRTLTWGSTGSDVLRLQQALLAAGYSEVRTADGIYGQWTYDAVRRFQREHGLSVDGIAGPKTLSKLYGGS